MQIANPGYWLTKPGEHIMKIRSGCTLYTADNADNDIKPR
jgi:hypothetical protein